MNKLEHPGSKFLQSLPYQEAELKDMTPQQQTAIWRYMYAQGDGIWGDYDSVEKAVAKLGDVRFAFGSFVNDDTMKVAFVSCMDGIELDDGDTPVRYFDENCIGRECDAEAIPVFLGNPKVCAEFGLFDDGFEEFYDYWAKQPETQFVNVLPSWSVASDERGGQ